jgi:two-component system response regulator RegX3
MSARILVVEDDDALRRGLAYAFERERFEVVTAADGEEGLAVARSEAFDLIVLDLMLPKLPGTEVCRRVRAENAVPIIMLTAKDSEVDKVVGLAVGADDYVTKPFSALELLGRVRALLRRRELDRRERSAVRVIGGLRIDFARHEVVVDGAKASLTPSELKVLHVLAHSPGTIVSKREILEQLWQTTHVGDQHACDVHISNLRRKLERDPANPQRIVTARGLGYTLQAI